MIVFLQPYYVRDSNKKLLPAEQTERRGRRGLASAHLIEPA
jgi:hypothetical protein